MRCGIMYLCMVLCCSAARGQLIFERIAGEAGCYEEAFSVVGYQSGYLVSSNYNCGVGPEDFGSTLLFLDSNGHILNNITGMTANGWMAYHQGYLVFAGGDVASLTYDTIVIAKTDESGNVIWLERFKFGVCNNVIYDIQAYADGYYFCGFYSTTPCLNAQYDAFLLKLDVDGNQQWLQTVGGPGNQQLYAIRKHADGHIAVFGWTQSPNDNLGKFLLVEYTAAGDSLRTIIIDEPGDFRGFGMDITEDGYYIVSGTRDWDAVGYKITRQGEVAWRTQLGLSCGGAYYKSYYTKHDYYLFTYLTGAATGCITHLVATDTSGNYLWEKMFPAVIRSLTEPVAGTWVLAGFSLRVDNLISDVYVARFDTTYIGAGSSSVLSGSLAYKDMILYPQPTSGKVYLAGNDSSFYNAIIIDLLSRRRYMNLLQGNILDISHLPDGMYLLELWQKNGNLIIHPLVKAGSRF